MRTFLAIDITDDIREKLHDEIERLERVVPADAVRWVRPESIHLTLKFLGEIDEGQLAEVKQAVRPIADATSSMQLAVVGFGVFPRPDRPRVLWVGVEEGSGRLEGFQGRLETHLESLGFERERHGFTPHLTLGRVRRGLGGRSRRELRDSLEDVHVGALGQVTAQELTLFHSDLRPSGAVYTPLAVFPFGAQ